MSAPESLQPLLDPADPTNRIGRWWHKGGYFTIEVTAITVNDKGRWYHFFCEQNCDNTFAEHADAMNGEAVVKKHWYDSNFMQVMHETRFLSKHVLEERTPASIKIKQYNERGHEIKFVTPTPKLPS